MESRETLLKLKEAQHFTVLANESMDISGTRQMAISVRYINEEEENTMIKKSMFLVSVPAHKLGLQATIFRGQGFDRASAMREFRNCTPG